MTVLYFVVLLSVLLIVYNYVLYPVLIISLAAVLRTLAPARFRVPPDDTSHTVSFIIAAYNEERVIGEKINNTLALDYPRERLEIIVVSDGSDDRTPEIVQQYEAQGVRLLHQPERRGKTAALNRAVAAASGDIIVFSDANNHFKQDAVRKLVRHFAQDRIGGVCGSKRIHQSDERESASGDGLYWKYESSIKSAESDIGSITGADGEIFAMRRHLYAPIPESVINDDAEITFRILSQGYRVIYDHDAESHEEASIRIQDDFNVKVRMVAGGYQTIQRWPLQTVVPTSWHAFTFLSHKVLRWLAPVFMIVAFFGTLALSGHLLYRTLFLLQLPIYLAALAGVLMKNKGTMPSVIYIPYYLVVMNAAAFVGLLRYLNKKQTTRWRKAER